MEQNHNLEGAIWMIVTFSLAVILAVNAIMSVFSSAELAYWQYPVLGMSYAMWRSSMSEYQLLRILVTVKQAEKKAARTFACLRRAVRSLPALFIQEYNRLQTEPW